MNQTIKIIALNPAVEAAIRASIARKAAMATVVTTVTAAAAAAVKPVVARRPTSAELAAEAGAAWAKPLAKAKGGPDLSRGRVSLGIMVDRALSRLTPAQRELAPYWMFAAASILGFPARPYAQADWVHQSGVGMHAIVPPDRSRAGMGMPGLPKGNPFRYGVLALAPSPQPAHQRELVGVLIKDREGRVAVLIGEGVEAADPTPSPFTAGVADLRGTSLPAGWMFRDQKGVDRPEVTAVMVRLLADGLDTV